MSNASPSAELDDKVVITGMGILSPFGLGTSHFLNALQTKKTGIRSIVETHPEESKIIQVAGFLPAYDFSHYLDEKDYPSHLKAKYKQLAARSSSSVQASLLATLEAYHQANLSTIENTEKIAILVTGNNTTQKLSFDQNKVYNEHPNLVSSRYAINFLDSSYIGYVSELFQIHGEGHVVGAASASGNMAIIQGMRLLAHKIVDTCIVIGVMADLSAIELKAFRQIGALGGKEFASLPDKASRPFDKLHEGFIPGQIAASLVLERSETAKTRNIPILGYVMGAAVVLDPTHSTSPEGKAEVSVMEKAIINAGISTTEVDYVNTHGTASVIGDDVEADALLKVFKTGIKENYVNSTKSFIGHGLWSAGVAESIATILQLNHGFLHPNLNLDEPISEKIGLIGTELVKKACKIGIKNSFAFSGINTCIVYHKGNV